MQAQTFQSPAVNLGLFICSFQHEKKQVSFLTPHLCWPQEAVMGGRNLWKHAAALIAAIVMMLSPCSRQRSRHLCALVTNGKQSRATFPDLHNTLDDLMPHTSHKSPLTAVMHVGRDKDTVLDFHHFHQPLRGLPGELGWKRKLALQFHFLHINALGETIASHFTSWLSLPVQ